MQSFLKCLAKLCVHSSWRIKRYNDSGELYDSSWGNTLKCETGAHSLVLRRFLKNYLFGKRTFGHVLCTKTSTARIPIHAWFCRTWASADWHALWPQPPLPLTVTPPATLCPRTCSIILSTKGPTPIFNDEEKPIYYYFHSFKGGEKYIL